MQTKKNKIKITNKYHSLFGEIFEVLEEHRSYFLAKLNKLDGTIVIYKNECKKLNQEKEKVEGK